MSQPYLVTTPSPTITNLTRALLNLPTESECPSSLIGEIFQLITRSLLTSPACDEVQSELALLRATTWTAPRFDVVAYRPQRSFTEPHADVFAGKTSLGLCLEMLTRVKYLSRRIEVLTTFGMNCDEEREQKERAYPRFEIRCAGLKAYQQALVSGCGVDDAIFAGLTAERKAMPSSPAVDDRPKPELKTSGRKNFKKKDASYRVYSRCAECLTPYTKTVKDEERPSVSDDEFCDNECKERWLSKHDLTPPKPEVRFNQVTSEDHDWAVRHSAFPRVRVSAANRAKHEKELFKAVASYCAKDHKGREEAPSLKKHGDLYREFLITFEFPKTCDQQAMEDAAQQLKESVPCDQLESLARCAAHKGLLEGSYSDPHHGSFEPCERTHRFRTRHYVLGKRCSEELTFVRQKDLNLAMGV